MSHDRPAARLFEPLEQRMLLSLTIDLDYSFDTQGSLMIPIGARWSSLPRSISAG